MSSRDSWRKCASAPGCTALSTRLRRIRAHRLKQRSEVIGVTAPALPRGRKYRLTHLGDACSPHRTLRCVKAQAVVVPLQAARFFHEPVDLPIRLSDEVFVDDVDYSAGRQNSFPMRHHLAISDILRAKVSQIVGRLVAASKKLSKTGKACIDRIADAVQDSSVREHQVNHPEVEVI